MLYFNSIKVQLKPKSILFCSSAHTDFNSIKVQLKRICAKVLGFST